VRSAFGVDHGEISKSQVFSNDKSPFAGGKWGPNATPGAKKKYGRRHDASLVTAGVGGGLIGEGMQRSAKPGKFSGNPLKTKTGNATHGKKRGIAGPSR
jgi:hypothetical protein